MWERASGRRPGEAETYRRLETGIRIRCLDILGQ